MENSNNVKNTKNAKNTKNVTDAKNNRVVNGQSKAENKTENKARSSTDNCRQKNERSYSHGEKKLRDCKFFIKKAALTLKIMTKDGIIT